MNITIILLLVCFVIIYTCFFKSNLIEGVDGEYSSEEVNEMSDNEFEAELNRIREENYSVAGGFEAMRDKGLCTNEPHTRLFHSCEINEATDEKQTLDLRYINPGPLEINESSDYTYNQVCLDKYAKTMDLLVSDQLKPNPEVYTATLDPSLPDTTLFFKNKYSIGQFPGYSENNYIDRIRYIDSDEPLPVNPDFFMSGGGTYA